MSPIDRAIVILAFLAAVFVVTAKVNVSDFWDRLPFAGAKFEPPPLYEQSAP